MPRYAGYKGGDVYPAFRRCEEVMLVLTPDGQGQSEQGRYDVVPVNADGNCWYRLAVLLFLQQHGRQCREVQQPHACSSPRPLQCAPSVSGVTERLSLRLEWELAMLLRQFVVAELKRRIVL